MSSRGGKSSWQRSTTGGRKSMSMQDLSPATAHSNSVFHSNLDTKSRDSGLSRSASRFSIPSTNEVNASSPDDKDGELMYKDKLIKELLKKIKQKDKDYEVLVGQYHVLQTQYSDALNIIDSFRHSKQVAAISKSHTFDSSALGSVQGKETTQEDKVVEKLFTTYDVHSSSDEDDETLAVLEDTIHNGNSDEEDTFNEEKPPSPSSASSFSEYSGFNNSPKQQSPSASSTWTLDKSMRLVSDSEDAGSLTGEILPTKKLSKSSETLGSYDIFVPNEPMNTPQLNLPEDSLRNKIEFWAASRLKDPPVDEINPIPDDDSWKTCKTRLEENTLRGSNVKMLKDKFNKLSTPSQKCATGLVPRLDLSALQSDSESSSSVNSVKRASIENQNSHSGSSSSASSVIAASKSASTTPKDNWDPQVVRTDDVAPIPPPRKHSHTPVKSQPVNDSGFKTPKFAPHSSLFVSSSPYFKNSQKSLYSSSPFQTSSGPKSFSGRPSEDDSNWMPQTVSPNPAAVKRIRRLSASDQRFVSKVNLNEGSEFPRPMSSFYSSNDVNRAFETFTLQAGKNVDECRRYIGLVRDNLRN